MRADRVIQNVKETIKEKVSQITVEKAVDKADEVATSVKGKVSECLVEMVITALGTIGIVNTLMDGCTHDAERRLMVFLMAMIFSCGWVILQKLNKYSNIIMAAGFGVMVLVSLITMPVLKEGILGIIDECIWDFSWYDSLWDDGRDWALIMFSVLVAYIISFNVTRLRSMILSIAHILPLMSIFVVVGPLPSIYSLLCCILYVVGLSALRRRESNTHSAVVIMTVAAITGFIGFICINEYNYKSPKLFDDIYYEVKDFFENVNTLGLENTGNENLKDDGSGSTIGMGNKSIFGVSQMGEVDTLKYSDKDMVIVNTINTGRNQYIPVYYGSIYNRSYNNWNVKNASTEKDEPASDITFILMQMIDRTADMQKYVAGTEKNYDRHVINYYYSFKKQYSSDNNRTYEGFIHEVDDGYYSKLYDITKKKVIIEADENIYKYTQESLYNTYEAKYRAISTGVYVQVNPEIKSVIEHLNGFDTNISGRNEVERTMAAIKQVKDYLAANCSYTLSPGKVPEGQDFVEYFLKHSKQGYCTYFASSATLMFRSMDIPARYVEGFVITPDDIKEGRQIRRRNKWMDTIMDTSWGTEEAYEVTIKDNAAHAWVEVFMPGYGWLPVEVTPPYTAGGIAGTQQEEFDPDNARPDNNGSENSTEPETATETETEEDSKDSTDNSEDESDSSVDEQDDDDTGNVRRNSGWWKLLIPAVLIGALLLLIIIHTVKYLRYKRSLKEDNLVALYELMERFFASTGYMRMTNTSYEEYAKSMENTEDIFKRHCFIKVTDMALKLRFGGDNVDVSGKDIHKACRHLRGIRIDIYATMSPYKRFYYKYFKIL